MTSVLEALKSAQFVVDTTGQRIAVQVNPTVWQALLVWLENVESVPTVEELTQTPTSEQPLEANTAVYADRALVNTVARLSEPSLTKVWDNPEDDIYNDL
ncbi:MAG: hypothetical protein F6K19_26680 [Cyanothece sp. SIO1E1]|nr:hypothetical protein [Cyanothece sp. SIO1E1]